MHLFARPEDARAVARPKPLINIELNHEYIQGTEHIERIRKDLAECPAFEVDSESTGLDCHADKLLLYQFGVGKRQYVVDARTVPLVAFKDILEDESRTKFLHNATHDYKFFKAAGVTMEGMWDTLLVECCLTAGLQKSGRGLDDCMMKYFNVFLDKEQQTTFINMPYDAVFSDKQIRYAAMDVAVVERLARAQTTKLKEWGLVATAKLECAAVPAFADMEFYGMHVDVPKWSESLKGAEKELSDIILQMNDVAVQRRWVGVDMWGRVEINWASTPQLLNLLRTVWDPKITSTDDDTLDDLYVEYGHPLLKLLREYRKLTKRTGTYGRAYLDGIHPNTGKLHASFNQYGTDTGRPSGRRPNMLNIPRDKTYRHSFMAPPGCDWHTRDYSGCELRIVASMSRDPEMCRAFNAGMDLHTYVAAKFKNLDYNTLVEQVKEGNADAKELRQVMKSLNFGVIYGLGPATLASDLDIPIALAREYYYGYKREFKVMSKFLEEVGIEAVERCYSQTVLGRKRFFRPPPYPQYVRERWLESGKRQKLFQFAQRLVPNYRDYKESCIQNGKEPAAFRTWVQGESGDPKVTSELVDYFKATSAIQRRAGNHPVQGGNADITKHAMVNIRKRFQRAGYYPQAYICLQVYDEICTIAPTTIRAEVDAILEEEMCKAGELVIRGVVPVTTDKHIGPTWTK